MKAIVLLFSLLTSSIAFASEPSAIEVFAAILKDSGVHDATYVLAPQDENADFGIGITAGTRHDVIFVTRGHRYTCPLATFHAHHIGAGQYFVDASIGNCRSEEGRNFIWNNDYTQNGVAIFTRVFYNDNTLFRFPSQRERFEWTQLLSRDALQN